MKRLLASRGTSVAAVGILAALIASGGYALASGGSSKKITVCVKHKGGALYKAKKCAKHDKKLTWNKQGPRGPQGIQGIQGQTGNTGPQGPGATSLVYTVDSTASPTPAAIGNVGPLALTGTCTQTGSGASAETEFLVNYSGPALQVDGFSIVYDGTTGTSFASSGSLPAASSAVFSDTGSTSTQSVNSGQLLLIPSSGSPLEIMATIAATGGSPPAFSNATANTCHLSVVATPVAAPAASTSMAHSSTGKRSGPLFGRP